MKEMRRALGVTVILGLVLALMLVVVAASPALGQQVIYEEQFTFPEEAIRSFESEVVVVDELLPAEVLGLRCTVSLTTHNSDSIHDTDLVVGSNGDEVVILDIEPGANVDKTAAGELTLGASITGTLVRRDTQPSTGKFVSSVGGTITVRCEEADNTTTTTEATTSTTEPITTTTPPSTVPTTSSVPTTTPIETTTTNPVVTTTAPSTTSIPTTISSTTPDTLPFTGVDSEGVGWMALVALVVGVTLAALTRKSKESAGF